MQFRLLIPRIKKNKTSVDLIIYSYIYIKRKDDKMAKSGNIKIRLESTAGTGYFYVTKKNNRTMTEKLVIKKYDPVAKKHVDFKENKIK